MKLRPIFFILFFVFIISFPYAYAYVNRSPAQDEYDFVSVAKSINFENIKAHVNNLTSFGSRTTGYEGCDAAAAYIYGKFKEYGLDPLEGNYFQKYDLLVPIDHNTTVEVLYPNGTQNTIEGYALWPNGVQACPTPPGGIEGTLIDAKGGSLSDFNGTDVDGSIVLMDFNSGDNWLNAAKFGATAAIFIEPYDTNRIEAEKKFTNTPLYFPRVFVKRSDGENLRQLAATETMRVRIRSNIRYETVQAKNVMGVIKGKNTNEAIIFSSYYDSWSVVPKLNPGADEASGVASLLELARFFSNKSLQEKPLRNLVFVAFSGHWEALAGAREFVETFIETESVVNGYKKYWFLINLDFSSDSEYVNYLYTGTLYHIVPGRVGNRFDPIILDLITREYVYVFEGLSKGGLWEYDFLKRPGGFGKIDLFGYAQFPTFVLIDSEPLAAAGGVGISFRTSRCYRLNWGHPFNTVDKVSFPSLKHQVVFAFCSAYALASESIYGWKEWSMVAPKRVWQSSSGTEGGGVVSVYGDVVEYDWVKGFYTNMNILQPGYQVLVQEFLGWNTWYAVTKFNPFARVITTVNASGYYNMHGLGSYYALGQFSYERTNGPYHFLAYVINRTTGQIEYAPDLGQWGLSQYKFREVFLKLHPQFVRNVVFKAGSIILYDLVDPGSLSPAAVCNYHTYAPQAGTWMIPMYFQVNDFDSHSWLTTFGNLYTSDTCENIAMIFVPPETAVEIVMIYAWAGGVRTLGVLANMSDSAPQGTGFALKAGEYLPLTFTALHFADDLYWLNRYRLELLLSYNVNSTLAVSWIKSAEAQLEVARSALGRGDYEKAHTAALSAWSFMSVTHSDARFTIDDTVKALVFFSAISIPFAFLAERLFVRAKGKRRIVAILGILSLLLVTLYFLHPGFRIASGSFALLLSFTALVLSMPVLAILLSNIFGFFKELRQKVIGPHFAEISRFGAVMMAFSVGIGNMWRRKLRTTLVLVTIILITVSLIALTSVASMVIPRTQTRARTTDPNSDAFYEGIAIKHLGGQADVSPGLIPLVETLLDEKVPIIARSWIFPPPSPQAAEAQTQTFFEVWGPSNTSFNAWVIEGMSPDEQFFTPINQSIVEGSWFTDEDFATCIISDYTQAILNVSLERGDRINIWGLSLTVKGIIDWTTGDRIRDIDYALSSYGLRPLMQLKTVGGMVWEEVSFKYIIVVPYKFAQSVLGTPTYTLSFKVPDVDKAKSTALKLVFGGAGFYDIHVGSNDTVSLYRSTVGFLLQGWQFMPIPIVLGALTVLNTMVAAIYERTREISVYSSVGLAPLHVAGMFFAESVVFAIIGGILGYLLGSGLLVLLINMQALPPGFIPNYSSFYVIIAVLISMAATMGASLLPLYMVSRQVTPSLERKWKIPTKPMGNEWAIPLPFEAEEEEVMGTLAFIKEFLETHAVERAEAFVMREISYKEELDERGRRVKSLMANIVLPPYDAAIVQNASVNARWSEEVKRYAFELYLKQLSGLQRGWIQSNRVFADLIRKQLLLWRGLTPKTRGDYVQKAKRELKTVKEKKG